MSCHRGVDDGFERAAFFAALRGELVGGVPQLGDGGVGVGGAAEDAAAGLKDAEDVRHARFRLPCRRH